MRAGNLPGSNMDRIKRTRRTFFKMAGVATASLTLPARTNAALLEDPKKDESPIDSQFRSQCGLLRLYDEFDSVPDKSAPDFQYECSHPELDRLREKYQLDRVAGTGNDWSKALALMK